MKSIVLAAALTCATSLAFGQSFEGAVTGGPNFASSSSTQISSLEGLTYDTGGWNLGFRMTVNPYSIFGFEVGYIYNRTHLNQSGMDLGGTAIHEGYGNALVYLTKEGSHIRPFGTAGINFDNFVIPGGNAQYGGQNKFGINYGVGVKVKVKDKWQVRFDLRQSNTGKPDFGIPGVSGRFLLTQFSVGFGIGI